MSSFNSGKSQWICFINGLEIPLIGAATTTQSGQLATAQITLPYSPFLNKLPKNTKITLYTYDSSKLDQPKLEFDGVIQAISWRKDKLSGNTALFIMAQTDGIIWSERKKYNFYIDTGFSIKALLATTVSYESNSTISPHPISDTLMYMMQNNNYDAGEISSIFLTHTFNKPDGNVATFNYTDCGYNFLRKSVTDIDNVPHVDPKSYANYIRKFYENYQVVRKLCRIPIPKAWKDSFQVSFDWKLMTKQLATLDGEVNFWNYVTYICDHFSFEIYDIPDCPIVTLSGPDMSAINKSSNKNINNSVMSEYIIKPKSPFGPIPYCNIIFPDQVLDKSFFKNYQNEVTRCWTIVNTFPLTDSDSEKTAGAKYTKITGPYFGDDTSSYFSSYNVSDPFSVIGGNPGFLDRNAYEEEFGVISKQVELPELLARLLTSKLNDNNRNTLQEMVNHEFFTAYTNKVTFTMQVTPDVDIIPGNSILVLDENDDHILAYCFGREKIWDKNGTNVVNLKIMFPRHYSLETGFANHYMNTFDPHFYSSTYKQDVSILEKLIGCKTIPQEKTIKSIIVDLMKKWNDTYNQNTQLMKQEPEFVRQHTSYLNYQEFFNITAPVSYDHNNPFNKMPEQLINSWDISPQAALMQALQYTYAENGYKNPQDTRSTPGFKPSYADLNVPGSIQVSTYISGIVNCHNRYLMQVGNSIT